METDVTAHLTAGAVIVYIIEAIKRSNWTFMTDDTKALNRFVSAVCALVAATGIAWTYDQASTEVVIRFTVSGVAAGTWEFLKQYIAQQLIYDAAINARRVKVGS